MGFLMVTIATAPDGTFYNDIISQDVDDYTFNGISRDAFLFDEAGVYRFEGGIVSPTDSADVVPIQEPESRACRLSSVTSRSFTRARISSLNPPMASITKATR